jgi:uncharacterized protein (DUF1499 family)
MLRKALKYSVAGVYVIILALVALRMTPWWDGLLTPSDHRAVQFETLVLTSKPNQYLVCPPDLCTEAKAHQESPQFDRTADDLRAAFETVGLGSEGVTKMAESEETLDLVARTPFVRWPDWVTVRFIPLGDNRSTLAIYSRSVYGSSDFGANKRRITNWLARLSAQP